MKEAKALAASWARSFLAASIALIAIGETDPKAIFTAGMAAVMPVILRYLNPRDSAFGVTGK
jgi:hypothetical protein